MTTPVAAAVYKPTASAETGVTLYDDKDGDIFVYEVQQGGLFESTDLQPGMQVLSVNNNSTQGMNAVAVTQMLNEAEGAVSILAQEVPQFGKDEEENADKGGIPYVTPPIVPTASPTPPFVAPVSATQNGNVYIPVATTAVIVTETQQQQKPAPAPMTTDEETPSPNITQNLVSNSSKPDKRKKKKKKQKEVCCNMTKPTLIVVICVAVAMFIAGAVIASYIATDGFGRGKERNNFDDDFFRPTRPPTPPPTAAPTLPSLVDYGLDAHIGRLLQKCEGDCDFDSHCAAGLICYQRELGDTEDVPGCAGTPNSIYDYCVEPPQLQDYGPDAHLNGTLGVCEGDCDSDSQCSGRMICYERDTGDTEAIPGCAGTPTSYHDYCIVPPLLVDYGENAHIGRTLALCEGDCDYDSHCAGGLKCFERDAGDTGAIPGCVGTPLSYHDYCVLP